MSESDVAEKWLVIEVCLMNAEEKERKVAGELTAAEVSMVTSKLTPGVAIWRFQNL